MDAQTSAAAAGDQPAAQPAPPAPWAFGAMYEAPLPPHLRFPPEDGFDDMVRWAGTHAAHHPDVHPKFVGPVLAYANKKEKDSWGKGVTGATRSGFAKEWRKGSVGLVASSMSSASEMAAASGRSDWHTVAVARDDEGRVFVHDPGFRLAAVDRSQLRRVDTVRGNTNVGRLVKPEKAIGDVWYQGPPDAYAGALECMGRSAQWAEETCNGTLPWPPDADSRGGPWIRCQKN